MLKKISYSLSLTPQQIVHHRNWSTAAPVSVATAALLGGAAAVPFSPIVGASVILGSALCTIATLVRYIWASRVVSREKEAKRLAGETYVRQLSLCDKACTKDLEHKLINGILSGTNKSGKIRNLCEKNINEFFRTEAVFSESIKQLLKKDWSLKGKDKGTFFDKLESEKLISSKERQALIASLVQIDQANESFFKDLGKRKRESPSDLADRLLTLSYKEKVQLYVAHFSPKSLMGHYPAYKNYIYRFDQNQTILNRALGSKKGKALQQEFFNKNQNKIFASFYIKPVQRAAQYPLLWADFASYVEKGSPDSATKALIQRRAALFHEIISKI